MKTFKLKISNNIDVTDWCKRYSYMYRKLYANFELCQDEGFQKELRERYNLDSWFYESCRIEVAMKKSQNETQRKNKLVRIESIEKELAEGVKENLFTGTEGKRRKYKLQNKLAELKKSIDNDITFGTKALLRRISYLPNYIRQLEVQLVKETDKEEIDKLTSDLEKSKQELAELKTEYQNNRVLSIISVGEAPQRSNRKFDFFLTEKKVTFKPDKNTKIPVEFHCSDNQYKELCLLQNEIGAQAITIRIDNEYLYITFDNEKLNNYAFNKNEYFKELKTIPRENKQQRKDCYKKWALEQEGRKFYGKNINRYIAVDLNPEYIGIAVLEKTKTEGSFKIIHTECIALTGLNTKLRLSSDNPVQVKQHNKRTHELFQAWKMIFNLSVHYKVANFVTEDLEFKQEGVNNSANEANRKTINIWHREQTIKAIQKYCLELGIKLIEVNACYSSFIGNIKHKFFDPVAAAIEIGRRGIVKYLKGLFFPPLERSDLDSMCQLGLDVRGKTVSNWKKAYNHFKTSGLRYRRELQNFLENNLQSHKSNVILYRFI